MNIDNGHLVRLGVDEGKDVEYFGQEMQKRMASYFAVPPELLGQAEKELSGRNETYIDLKAATPLASWAAKQRAERDKKKNKRRMVKKSKQRNRV